MSNLRHCTLLLVLGIVIAAAVSTIAPPAHAHDMTHASHQSGTGCQHCDTCQSHTQNAVDIAHVDCGDCAMCMTVAPLPKALTNVARPVSQRASDYSKPNGMPLGQPHPGLPPPRA